MPPSSPRTGLRPTTSTTAELARLHRNALPDPAALPAPFEVACWSRPAEVIGGDLLAVWPAGRDRLLVFLADVMGHDLTAAMIASAVRLDLYRARESGVSSPAAILRHLDQGISELFRGHFVTAACCLLDARQRSLTWSLAGHPPVLLLGGDGRVRGLHHQAYPLGLRGDERYRDERVALMPGGSVLLYSDGVSDPLGSPGYPGSEVLAELLSGMDAPPAEMVRLVRRAVRPFRRTDDRSLLGVRVRPAYASSQTA